MKLRFTAFILAFLIILAPVLCSCAEKPKDGSENPTTEDNNNESTTAAEDEYFYADENYNNDVFNILNIEPTWDFYTDIILEAQTGEILDDAIYARNRFIEEKFNIDLKQTCFAISDIENKIKNTVLAGENAYQAVYCPGNNNAPIGGLVTQNLFFDLADLPELNLKESWWDQAIMKNNSIGPDKAVFFASNDVHIMCLQGAWVLYFNEKMMTDLGLEKPYDLVRTGKWTLDELHKYMKAGAQLNGSETYKWDAAAQTAYGLTSFNSGAAALLYGTGEEYIKRNDNNEPYLAAGNERFYNICDKIAEMLGTAGEYLTANDYQTPFHFETIFMNSRALFVGGEIKASNTFRSMETPFGLVPMPKYDESQPEYHSTQFRQSPLLCVPVTNPDPKRAGVILDALAYYSHKTVTPVFYDVTVSQKGLRNEDSIEMLRIVRNTRYYDVGMLYGWTADIYESIRTNLDTGKSGIAAIIEKQKGKIDASITKTMEEVGKMK